MLEDADGNVRASQLGEIVPAQKHGFYSYEAKYLDADGAALRIPADGGAGAGRPHPRTCHRAFRLLNCEGMARVDFFLKDDDIFVNELNTLPGFTEISMYPKLWEASGLSQGELMDTLDCTRARAPRATPGLELRALGILAKMIDDENLKTERPTFVTHLECSYTGERFEADKRPRPVVGRKAAAGALRSGRREEGAEQGGAGAAAAGHLALPRAAAGAQSQRHRQPRRSDDAAGAVCRTWRRSSAAARSSSRTKGGCRPARSRRAAW